MIKRDRDEATSEIVKADVPNSNGVVYTKECLHNAMREYMGRPYQTQLGVTYRGPIPPMLRISDVSFIVTGMDLNEEGMLSATAKLIPVPNERVNLMDKLRPGSNPEWSMGLRVVAEEGGTKEVDGKLIVNECKIEAISILPTKDKA